VKKLVALGAGSVAIAAAAVFSPAVAHSEPASASSLNVVGIPYGKALQILKSQNVKAFFGGSTGGDVPQALCVVSQQKITGGGRMYLTLDCTQAAADAAAGNMPAAPAAPAAPGAAPGAPAPAPGAGQGTYGGPIGVPVPVG
jgi:hypothetical protein